MNVSARVDKILSSCSSSLSALKTFQECIMPTQGYLRSRSPRRFQDSCMRLRHDAWGFLSKGEREEEESNGSFAAWSRRVSSHGKPRQQTTSIWPTELMPGYSRPSSMTQSTSFDRCALCVRTDRKVDIVYASDPFVLPKKTARRTFAKTDVQGHLLGALCHKSLENETLANQISRISSPN